MVLDVLILIGAFAAITLGAGWLVDGSAAIAKGFGLSTFFIGVTIVGLGTNAPELATSLTAAVNGLSDICMGNIVGSNTINIALVMGIAALICPMAVNVTTVRVQSYIMVAVAFIPFVSIATGGVMTRFIGFGLLALLAVFIVYTYRTDDGGPEEEVEEAIAHASKRTWVNVLLVIAGLALLIVGAKYLVEAAVRIAEVLGVSELAVGLTVVAFGTSTPELVTSVTAALKRHTDMAIGNIIGSNIFNMLGIVGAACIVHPQAVNKQLIVLETPFLVFLSVSMLVALVSGKKVSRPEGAFVLGAYGVYIVVLFLLAPKWFG